MQVAGEFVLVVGKEAKEETSRGGTLVTICSRGYLSMLVGAEVGLTWPSMDRSNDEGRRAGVTNWSRYD